MMWPFGGSAPAESTTLLMEPTLASQIMRRQMQIPFGGIRMEKIPLIGMNCSKGRCIIPLCDAREIPNMQEEVRARG
jgi:hypothetical protein